MIDPTLVDLGERLRKLDRNLISLLAERMAIASQVGKVKRAAGDPIFRPTIEDQRLETAREWAREKGLNPNFAHCVLYLIIDEACKVQTIELQTQTEPRPQQEDEAWSERLKQNLLAFTAKLAPVYDERYSKSFPATRAFLDFETNVLEQEINQLDDKTLALDLGCGTGRRAFELARSFDRVIGYDISPAMITNASEKASTRGLTNVSFETVDLELGIPQADASVSFACMTLGTASYLRNLPAVLLEALRVLKPGGRLFLSFENADALVYRWPYLPWEVGIGSEINTKRRCLDVYFEGKNYQVYARPYTVGEVRQLLPDGIQFTQTLTYPTVSALLPSAVLEEKATFESIAEIDRRLAEGTEGAYVIATGRRV